MSSPWLSVLIPVYRVEPWLAACIESVRSQADEGVEVLLLDDASPDRSGTLAYELVADWPQAQVLKHVCNRGLSAARNSLLKQASGDYVWFLDSDDVLLPGAISGLRTAIEQGGPDLVLCDFAMVRERLRIKHRLRGELHRRSFAGPARQTRAAGPELLAGLLEYGQLHSWSKIARRSVWLQAPFPEGRYFEDIAVIPALIAHARTYHYVDRPWVGYRQRDGSILASDSAEKIRHLVQSAIELREGLHALPAFDMSAAQFALDHFCVRSLMSTVRRMWALNPAAEDLAKDVTAAASRLLPNGLQPVLAAYRKRGWIWRSLRVQRRLGAFVRVRSLRADT